MIFRAIPNRKNPYLDFSSNNFPEGQLGKSDENMKISKRFKSSFTSLFQKLM